MNRIPTQERATKKKNKIIKEGFKLICEKGYHNVTTKDIAKKAGVSTGIIYQYFNNKNEIFEEGAKIYLKEIMFPLYSLIDENQKLPNDLNPLLEKIIKMNVKKHKIFKKAHNEITSMESINKNIEKLFEECEVKLSNKLYNLFQNNNYKTPNLKEKTHIIVILIDSIAHEEVYHNHKEYNYQTMEQVIIKLINEMVKEKN